MQSLESRSVVDLKKETGNVFHLDVHYVCMLVQRFQPQPVGALQISIIIIIICMGNTANQLLRETRSIASPHFEHRFRAPSVLSYFMSVYSKVILAGHLVLGGRMS